MIDGSAMAQRFVTRANTDADHPAGSRKYQASNLQCEGLAAPPSTTADGKKEASLVTRSPWEPTCTSQVPPGCIGQGPDNAGLLLGWHEDSPPGAYHRRRSPRGAGLSHCPKRLLQGRKGGRGRDRGGQDRAGDMSSGPATHRELLAPPGFLVCSVGAQEKATNHTKACAGCRTSPAGKAERQRARAPFAPWLAGCWALGEIPSTTSTTAMTVVVSVSSTSQSSLLEIQPPCEARVKPP